MARAYRQRYNHSARGYYDYTARYRGGYAGYNDQYGPQLPAGYNVPQPKKQNGAKKFTARNGVEYISGWCNDRYKGFIKVLVYRVEKSAEIHTSKSGKEYCSVRAKVTFANGQTQIMNALLVVATGAVKIKDLGFIVNPNKNYCGPIFKKK